MAAGTGFGRRLAALMLGGFVLRVLYTLLVADGIPVIGDALTYHLQGANIADGGGFTRVFHPQLELAQEDQLGGAVELLGPTAEHPPLFSVLLAGLVKLGADGYLAQKLVMCAVGTATVGLIGLVGREVGGARVGLVAAGLAATYPFLWVIDGSLMSETPYAALIAAVLLAAVRLWRAPSLPLAAALGALVALAALTRGEAILLVPLLMLPLALRAAAPPRRRLALAAAGVGATVAVLAPWTIRNFTVFEEPVLISTNSNAVFVGSNCDPVYRGPFVGLWNFSCYGQAPRGDESEQAAEYRRRGLGYARDHAGRLPVVAVARLGRVWDVYRPLQQVEYELFEGRSRWASRMGLAFYYPLLILAAVGSVVLRRRRGALLPLLAPLAMVSLTALLVYGVTRFRVGAEPALVVLGAVGLDATLARLWPRWSGEPVEQLGR